MLTALRGGVKLSRLSSDERRLLEMPWFHNFAPLGMPTAWKSEAAEQNQLEKQSLIFRHVRDALLRCPPRPRGLDLFCTDGMFGLYALRKGARQMDIFDVGAAQETYDAVHLAQTRMMAKLLGLEGRARIEAADPYALEGHYDFCICATVLCHVREPQRLFEILRQCVQGPLVVQTPVSLANRKPDYFESPALYRPWGSRFSQDKLILMAVDAGWTVVSELLGQLPANGPRDRGSAHLLCV